MKQNNGPITVRAHFERQRRLGEKALLWILALIVLNVILYAMDVDLFFAFAAYTPCLMAMTGIELCRGDDGLMPNPTLGIFFLSIALLISLVYVLCYLLGRKKIGWIIAGAAFFTVDTVMVFPPLWGGGDVIEIMLTILFRVLFLGQMISSITAHYKLKTLPPEKTDPAEESGEPNG